jgi:hypothetical protein
MRVARFAATVAAIAFIAVAVFGGFWAAGGSLVPALGVAVTNICLRGSELRARSRPSYSWLRLSSSSVVRDHWGYPDRVGIFRWGKWALVGVMALSALANFASSSRLERLQNGPVALIRHCYVALWPCQVRKAEDLRW